MANKIGLITNKRDGDFATKTSRYSESTPIYYTIGDVTYITFSMYRKKKMPELSSDKFAVIPSGFEYRPDLISQETYGTPDFWWKIMEANNIKDVFDFKAGLSIRLPSNIY